MATQPENNLIELTDDQLLTIAQQTVVVGKLATHENVLDAIIDRLMEKYDKYVLYNSMLGDPSTRLTTATELYRDLFRLMIVAEAYDYNVFLHANELSVDDDLAEVVDCIYKVNIKLPTRFEDIIFIRDDTIGCRIYEIMNGLLTQDVDIQHVCGKIEEAVLDSCLTYEPLHVFA
jgi:hypothetical protein